MKHFLTGHDHPLSLHFSAIWILQGKAHPRIGDQTIAVLVNQCQHHRMIGAGIGLVAGVLFAILQVLAVIGAAAAQ